MFSGDGGSRNRDGAAGNARYNDCMNPFTDELSQSHGKPSNIDSDNLSMKSDMERHHEYKLKRKLNESEPLNIANLIRAR
jgi:hypothetical protein